MNNLKNHIDAALRGSKTTGVNVNPWRIGDGYTTPNIHQPWTPLSVRYQGPGVGKDYKGDHGPDYHNNWNPSHRRSADVEEQDDKVQRDRLYGLPF